MSPKLLSRETLAEAFGWMDRLLAARGVRGEIYMFGGSAIVFSYRGRPATLDLDGRFEPQSAVHAVAVEVADRLGIDRGWLNDQATSYLTTSLESDSARIVDLPNLTVASISPDRLLVMKVGAARPWADYDDIDILLTYLGLTSAREVLALCEELNPGQALPEGRDRLLAEALTRLEGPGARASRAQIAARLAASLGSHDGRYRCQAITANNSQCSIEIDPGQRCPVHNWIAPRL